MLKRLKLALERLEKLSKREFHVVEDKVFDVLDKFGALLLEMTKPGSQQS